jgi:type II secretory pathway component PulF
MATFRFVARDSAGREVEGTVQAATRLEASQQVRAQGYWLLDLYLVPDSGAGNQSSSPGRAQVAQPPPAASPIFGGAPLKELALFFRQLSTSLSAGVPIFQAMDTLGNQRRHPRLRRAILDIRDRVLRGERISDAFDHHPALFSPIIRAMIRVGESGGVLESSLRQIADYLENELELRRLLSRVTFYPKLVLALMVPILMAPSMVLRAMGQGGGNTLTDSLASFAASVLFTLIIALALLWLAFRIAMRSQTFRWLWGLVTVAVPWIGFTVRQLALARFARALSALYNAGLPLSQAIRIAADACGNEYLASQLKPASSKIEAGVGITRSLAESRVLPQMVMDMVATGENTGELGFMMDKVAEYYEEEGKMRSHQAGYIFGVVIYLMVAIFVLIVLINFYSGYFSSIFSQTGP